MLEEEATKRAELEQIHLRQQRAISETEAEKQELEKERLAKESALQAAMQQLEHLEKERQGALEQYQVSCTSPSPDSKIIVLATRRHCVAAGRLSQTLSVVSVVLLGQTVVKKLEDATNNTKTWKHKVAEHEGLLRLIQPGNRGTPTPPTDLREQQAPTASPQCDTVLCMMWGSQALHMNIFKMFSAVTEHQRHVVTVSEHVILTALIVANRLLR